MTDDPKTVPPSIPATPPATTGAYRVWPADINGELVGDRTAPPNPSLVAAVDIYFGLLASTAPPAKDQSDLQLLIGQVLAIIRTLYLPKTGDPLPPFRLYYTRLFRLAQLGLEGAASPDIAKLSLNQLTDDLIDAEGARVKNAHLTKLGIAAAGMAAGFLMLYFVLCAPPPAGLLTAISVNPVIAKSFMLLWVGCFGGVWLSYAIRTTTVTLRDLVVADADRLLPVTRLVFAGTLTMTLGLLLLLGFVDVKVGGEALSKFAHEPTKALLLGIFCGISELLLPTVVANRAKDLLSKVS